MVKKDLVGTMWRCQCGVEVKITEYGIETYRKISPPIGRVLSFGPIHVCEFFQKPVDEVDFSKLERISEITVNR